MGAVSSRVYRCRGRDGKCCFDIPDGGAVVVGRTPGLADVAIHHPALARRHVRFRNEGGVLTVELVDCRGTIKVNGEHVDRPGRHALCPGDEVGLLPEISFVVEVVDELD